ncbi:hypothetical protein ACHAQD_008405 [Fusarium lateritium]
MLKTLANTVEQVRGDDSELMLNYLVAWLIDKPLRETDNPPSPEGHSTRRAEDRTSGYLASVLDRPTSGGAKARASRYPTSAAITSARLRTSIVSNRKKCAMTLSPAAARPFSSKCTRYGSIADIDNA